ncbi:MAG: RNA 3'-terminal phosphate cyclase [Chloroflexi bacterium]|nr:RNA 3'-terminal phosphate cyclase [Chloroflexota bacterium]
MHGEPVVIDGSQGEGGGQILRAALSLSVHTGRPFRLIRIRARRSNPGLRPQHVTAVRAAAALCNARVEGDSVGSHTLLFEPTRPPKPGSYRFDVGTAGATTLILETILPPLAELDAPSWVSLTGGTHVPWSPVYHYVERVFLPAVRALGWDVSTTIKRWGWYPRGGGRIQGVIRPPNPPPERVDWVERGALRHVWLLSASSNLPAHIRQRQAKRAQQRLREAGVPPDEVEVVDAPSPGVGTVVVVVGTYERGWGGGAALGKKGKPAERVAEEAVDAFLQFHRSRGALDVHLADQVIVPLLVRGMPWRFSTPHVTDHLRTVIWLSQHFVPARMTIEEYHEEQRVIVQCLNSSS